LSISKIAERDHLNDNNWHEWKEHIKCVLINCDINRHIEGTIKKPGPKDPEGAHNWDKNNTWAQQVIIHNVTSSQMNHIGSKSTAVEMVSALVDMHDNKVHQMVNHIQTLLYETKVADQDDLLKHLDVLKLYQDHLNRFPNPEFHIYDTRFKSIISTRDLANFH
jgi:hypothetical protein